jgi:hypothetical protein
MTKQDLKQKVRDAYWASVRARNERDEDKAVDILNEARWLRWQVRRCESWHGSKGLALTRELLSRATRNCREVL